MKTLFRFIFGFTLVLGLLVSTVPQTMAAGDEPVDTNPVVQPTIPTPDFLPSPEVGAVGADTQNYILNKTVPQAINIGIAILSITAFIAILFAAIQLLTSYGNDEKVTKAKTNLKYAVLGLFIVILAYAIVSIVVSLALPNEDDANSMSFLIPKAYAVDVEDDINILLPNQQTMIGDQDPEGRVSLPGGDFLGEMVPAIITNAMYAVGFLIFIAFMYGGTIMIIGRGNEEEVTKAKHILIYAAIALALVSLGYALVYGITTLNLNKSEDTPNPGDNVFSNEAPQ